MKIIDKRVRLEVRPSKLHEVQECGRIAYGEYSGAISCREAVLVDLDARHHSAVQEVIVAGPKRIPVCDHLFLGKGREFGPGTWDTRPISGIAGSGALEVNGNAVCAWEEVGGVR